MGPISQMGKRNPDRQSEVAKVTHLATSRIKTETLTMSHVFFSSFSLGDRKSSSPKKPTLNADCGLASH